MTDTVLTLTIEQAQETRERVTALADRMKFHQIISTIRGEEDPLQMALYLEQHRDFLISYRSEKGASALFESMRLRELKATLWLLNLDLPIYEVDFEGNNVLHLVQRLPSGEDKEQILKYLSRSKIPITQRNAEGHTPFSMALYAMNESAALLMIEENEIFDSNDHLYEGQPLLIACVEKYMLKLIPHILETSPNVDAQNLDGNTALITAAEYNNVDAAKLLLGHGASLHIKNHFGQTVWDIAKDNGSKEMIDYLETISKAK